MSETANTRNPSRGASEVPDLEQKYRRVIARHGRLERLVGMRATGIVLRNEQRMLDAAVADLFDDAEVEAIVAYVGAGVFAHYLNYISGAEIAAPVARGRAVALVA